MEIDRVLYYVSHSKSEFKIYYKVPPVKLEAIAHNIRDGKPVPKEWDSEGLIDHFLLDDKELQSTLEEYQKNPKGHKKDRDLWIMFMCCCVLVWPDYASEWSFKSSQKDFEYTADKYIRKLYKIPDGKEMPELLKPSCPQTIKDKAWAILEYVTSTLNAHYRFRTTESALSEVVTCDNKHDAMMCKLLRIITYPDEARGECNLKRCKECNALFVRNKGEHFQYCELHRGNVKAVMRSNRKKGK